MTRFLSTRIPAPAGGWARLIRLGLGLVWLTCAACSLALSLGNPAPDAITPDGGRYFGPLVDGLRQGEGRVEWADGSRYEGGFEQGLYAGPGHLRGRGIEYSGSFREGVFWGQGRLVMPDGSVLEGTFVRGHLSGEGRRQDAYGGVYVGTLADDEVQGQGRYQRKDGSVEEGSFVRGLLHGHGRLTTMEGDVYEGDFVDGVLQGVGRFQGRDGRRYQGRFQDFRYEGLGSLQLANGDRYDGEFRDGLYQGQGTLTLARPGPDGRRRISGMWQAGELLDHPAMDAARARVEEALYRQPALLEQGIRGLQPRTPGRINLYFLGVAGHGGQEVFRREVEFARAQFGREFAADGHIISLINSRSTMETSPMATVHSIEAALEAIAQRMDREQDILFLFVTSHGSHDHQITLDQPGLDFRSLRAEDLAASLRKAGIRWKVIVLSACYSGGFIPALQDEHTLIITAARADRTSFGCADEAEFTDFGRAFFVDALPFADSFGDAFARADTLIRTREEAEFASEGDLEGHRSYPQLVAPAPVTAQLQRWWQQLKRTPQVASRPALP